MTVGQDSFITAARGRHAAWPWPLRRDFEAATTTLKWGPAPAQHVHLRLAALAAFALLAGCSQAPPPADSEPTVTDDVGVAMASEPKVLDGSGTITAGVGTPALSFQSGGVGAEFTVTGNVTLVYVEMAWESPAIALDLCIHAPSDGDQAGVPTCGVVEDGGMPGLPANLVTHTRAAPEAGAGWTASPFIDGAAANQDFQLKVTLFYGETAVPDGYTALA